MTKKKIKDLIAKMTLEEKAAMCSGADFWHTESCERLGAVLLPVAKGFDDKMSSDRRVTANRAYARDNPLMRFICLRLLYHKSNRREPIRRYAVLLSFDKRI